MGGEGGDQPVVRGATAPDFSLSPPAGSVDRPGEAAAAPGDPITLSTLHGRVVLVNFWATWCEPCEREIPAMERLYERLPREGFELVAVSIDDEDAKVVDFVKRYALRFPVVMDRGKQVSIRYQTTGVPESLLVDREGHVVERYVGPRDWDAPEYVARIESLLEPSTRAADASASAEPKAAPDVAPSGTAHGKPGRSAAGASAAPGEASEARR